MGSRGRQRPVRAPRRFLVQLSGECPRRRALRHRPRQPGRRCRFPSFQNPFSSYVIASLPLGESPGRGFPSLVETAGGFRLARICRRDIERFGQGGGIALRPYSSAAYHGDGFRDIDAVRPRSLSPAQCWAWDGRVEPYLRSQPSRDTLCRPRALRAVFDRADETPSRKRIH